MRRRVWLRNALLVGNAAAIGVPPARQLRLRLGTPAYLAFPSSEDISRKTKRDVVVGKGAIVCAASACAMFGGSESVRFDSTATCTAASSLSPPSSLPPSPPRPATSSFDCAKPLADGHHQNRAVSCNGGASSRRTGCCGSTLPTPGVRLRLGRGGRYGEGDGKDTVTEREGGREGRETATRDSQRRFRAYVLRTSAMGTHPHPRSPLSCFAVRRRPFIALTTLTAECRIASPGAATTSFEDDARRLHGYDVSGSVEREGDGEGNPSDVDIAYAFCFSFLVHLALGAWGTVVDAAYRVGRSGRVDIHGAAAERESLVIENASAAVSASGIDACGYRRQMESPHLASIYHRLPRRCTPTYPAIVFAVAVALAPAVVGRAAVGRTAMRRCGERAKRRDAALREIATVTMDELEALRAIPTRNVGGYFLSPLFRFELSASLCGFSFHSHTLRTFASYLHVLISQDLLPLERRDISVTRVSVDKVSAPIMRPLKALTHVGVSTQLSSNRRLKRLAPATRDTIVLVSVDSNAQLFLKMRDTALAELLLDGPVLIAFGIARIALQIHRDIRAHFNNSVDLSTLCSLSTHEIALPSRLVGTRHPRLGAPCAKQITKSLKVNTKNLMPKELSLLGDLVLQADTIAALKPKEVLNDFIRGELTAEGMKLENIQYQNRTSVIMTNDSGQELIGHADGAKGRTNDIKFKGTALTGKLAAVRVVGKEELTNAEKARDEFILLALHGELQSEQREEALHVPFMLQTRPPGTGKTKIISAAAAVWEDDGSPAWIVAQSNVAVKNIAEKLAQLKFLVWTDELMADERGIACMLADARIVLSTLSTLSNPGLDHAGISFLVPVEKLVVDEASQINGFDFVVWTHLPGPLRIYVFHKSLEQVYFFGDPLQLPPYGQDQVSQLKSIFDFEHLRHLTEFLDTQYRMPVPIGEFISARVYNRRLRSQNDITSMDCVAFIDVVKGVETASALSWKAGHDFCVIIPYDTQRAAIERQLKAENLSHDAIFNVNSFQVRTDAPGFLRSLNPMNRHSGYCDLFIISPLSRGSNSPGTARAYYGIGDMVESWRRPMIKDSDFLPLPSTSAFARQTQTKVISKLQHIEYPTEYPKQP
ncbi:hypothetical protein B0H14DRAFT_2562042 [Mycena olivaceomarginata]|nr:hypothetical protein B0H14DRAFT_2562042 [Mycena olivaceomarginata]